jgi:hypothetical protein
MRAQVFELLDRKLERPPEAQRPVPPPATGHVAFEDVRANLCFCQTHA